MEATISATWFLAPVVDYELAPVPSLTPFCVEGCCLVNYTTSLIVCCSSVQRLDDLKQVLFIFIIEDFNMNQH